MNRIIVAAMAICAMLSSCTGRNEKPAVDPEQIILSNLKIGTVALEPFTEEFRTVGTVQAETGRYAEVGVPFDGRVLKSFVRLGQKVRAGQVLFEITSPEYLEISKSYLQSLKSYEKAKADYERKKELAEHGITSKRELEEAYTEAENARQDLVYAEATLRVYGTDPAVVKSGEAMKVVAPISGEVAMNNVTVGAYTKADSDALVTIANLDKVWVMALVKERFIGSVTEGATAEIVTEADPENVIEGEILNVGNIVDEQTRSVQVMISCDNSDLRLKHGMYVSVHMYTKTYDSVVLPSTAVFQGDNMSYVYVCTDKDGEFEKRPVVLGNANDDNSQICIKSGINPGERVVLEGGLYLNK